jgi:hypothetical protein
MRRRRPTPMPDRAVGRGRTLPTDIPRQSAEGRGIWIEWTVRQVVSGGHAPRRIALHNSRNERRRRSHLTTTCHFCPRQRLSPVLGGRSWRTRNEKERAAGFGRSSSGSEAVPLRDDLQLLPHFLHVLLEEVLLDVHHVQLTALDVRLQDVARHVDRRARCDQERRLLPGFQ